MCTDSFQGEDSILIHDFNPSQLSGASHRSSEDRCEKHYWMRGATQRNKLLLEKQI